MKKYIIIFPLYYLSTACSVNKEINCNENLIFKEVFFNSIKQVENITFGRASMRDDFNDSIYFLDDYVKVSDKMLNFTNTDFEKEKTMVKMV